MSATPNPYDELPYDSQPIPSTAPEQLSLVSRYHGGPAPPVKACQYLEIGCGDASNLLALAFHRRDGRFVGLDGSAHAIEAARTARARLGLDNLELEVIDLERAALALEGRRFDYVLVHGLLSWVSAALREDLMALVAASLAPNGVAHVSYNTMPGGGPRGLMRQALLRLAHPGQPLRERLARARELATFIGSELSTIDDPYAATMVREAARVVHASDSYLAHEILAPHNHAFWLGDFVALVERYGLGHIGDNWLYQRGQRPPPALWESVCEAVDDREGREELADLLRYRQLRCSLLRQADATRAPFSGSGLLEVVGVASCFQPEPSSPLAVATAQVLWQRWPASAPFGALLSEVSQALDQPSEELRPELAALLHALFLEGEADWRLREPTLRLEVSSLGPDVAPDALARQEAATRGTITTPSHRSFQLSDLQREEIASGRVSDPDTVALLAAWGMLA